MQSQMTSINLAIRDFAIPVPRIGSIESLSGFGQAALEGREVHLSVQERRRQIDPTYQAEVKISHDFNKDGYLFQIGGRMDGFYPHTRPRIEEIKSTLNIQELVRKLTHHPYSHPYGLQLLTYGYFYWLQNEVLPDLVFHLVSTRTQETEDLEVKLDIERYEEWLNKRLDELVKEAKHCEKRSERRKKSSENFQFPFERPRMGQVELIQTIENEFNSKATMLLQAPTGLGKTVGVLYPMLKESLNRGQNTIYVTPKNSQHLIAEDAIKRFRDSGTSLKSLTITAKSKICFKNEPLCNPEYCEYAKDYYTKLHKNDLVSVLAKKRKYDKRLFQELGEEFQVCPFELQLEAAPEADTIICDYNYVFAPGSFLDRVRTLPIGQEGKPNLVIDEAHNLPSRAMDYYSPAISSVTLEKIREEMRTLPKRFVNEAEELLDGCIQVMISCKPKECNTPQKITPKLDLFLAQDLVLKKYMSRYVDSNPEILPKDAVLRLCFYWAEFTSILESVLTEKNPEFFTTYHPHPTGGTIKITCCDASKKLEPCYQNYDHVVGFSATLKPFNYYARLSGLNIQEVKTAEFASPFSQSHRKILIIPQISTKYSDRERNYPRVAETIRRISSVKKGNYFAFFPSFVFLERVLEIFDAPEGFTILRQERDMKLSDFERIIDHLKDTGVPTLIFAVQGGIFSEGVDYPGEMIIGAFVVGPPLPNFELEREEMKKYYDQNYSSGFDYAYTFPAMAKAIQAAGRVIRTETDKGIIVLIDSRFVQNQYFQTMPGDWFNKSPLELVSNKILSEVADFWNQSDEVPVSQARQALPEN